ncbi:MAG TPA: sigma-70 family RNA polymerase sigma factor [Burkholderiales bacterium]|jgi:RNA polymerase sigma factor (sigma-70 family)|nr:sigma-70 family RNA polymerase sigma factor [Burkholderiales bacterium]
MEPSTADREFFERGVGEALDGLYGAALRMCRNDAQAQDLVAEAVIRAWSHFGDLRDRQCFRAWLFKILTNVFFEECRRQAANPKPASLDALAEEDEASGAPFSIFERLHQPFLLWWGSPEQEFLNGLLREHLERAVAALPEAFRVALVLCELQGFSYQEIADMLGVPVGTVRSRLARARSMLQRALWEDAQAAGVLKPGAGAPRDTADDVPSA